MNNNIKASNLYKMVMPYGPAGWVAVDMTARVSEASVLDALRPSPAGGSPCDARVSGVGGGGATPNTNKLKITLSASIRTN